MIPKSILFRGRVALFCVLLIATQFIVALADAQMRQVYKDEFKPQNEIRGISFYSPSAGFVAFDDWIGYTTDSGRTFTQKPIAWGNVDYDGYPVNLTFGFDPKGIKAFDQNNIIVCGHYGLENTILRSTDGGNTFKVVFHKGYNPNITSEGITDVQFVNNSIGYAVDEDLILKTTNGGQTWSLIRADAGSWFNRINIIDNSNLFVYSTAGNGKILKSSNAGSSWQPVTLPGNRLHGAYFLTTAKGWVSMGDDGIYQTVNGGASWTRQNHPAVPFRSERMIFTNDNTGYSLGGIFGICKTTDAGKIWEPLPRDSDISEINYNDLFFYNSDQLWAGGNYGFLELSTNAGGTPLPRAFFTIDTSGLFNTGMVNLTNHSKTGYTFKWFKNDTLIGTGYHASFNRGAFAYPLQDTFMLVASNGVHTDTATLYQYYHEPVYISSFSPVMAASLATVTITGAHFSGATAVSFGGTPAASFTIVNDNSITAIVGGGASGNVTVVTSGRSTATVPGFSFLPRPVITSFSPTAATAGSVLTISGVNFDGIKAVRIGGKPATSYTVVSSTTITAVAPSGGSGSIEVIANAGDGERAGFVAIPTLLSFTPTKGTHGSLLKIKGTSLADVTGIKLGGALVQSFTILSADSISAIVGEGSSGNLELAAVGGTVSLPGFTYNNPPVITAFAPLSGPIGTTVTITGTNFRPVAGENIVLFGTLRATVTAASTTSLSVTVPAGATVHHISVTANDLTAFSSRSFQTTFTGGGVITPASFVKTNITTEGPGVWRDYIDKVVADIDGDGKQDLLITDGWMGGQADILRNTTTGNTFSYTPYLNAAQRGLSIAFADLDGDGKSDYITSGYSAVEFYRNFSTPGSFSFSDYQDRSYFGVGACRNYQNIVANDVDKDGKTDVVLATLDNIYVFRNIGEPGLLAFEPIALPYGGFDLTMADIDLDGKPDIIQFNPATGTIAVYKNTSTKGNVSFTLAVTLPATTPFALATGDVDGDGLADIVAGSQDGNKIEVFRNTTAGSTIAFATPKQYPMPAITYDIALADLDGNGKVDITASTDTYHFVTFTNVSTAGNINFEPSVNHSPNTYMNYRGYRFMISIGDLNADGRPDPLILDKSQQARLCLYTNESIAKPYIREFTPANASKDEIVTIKGRNFTGVTAVNFGGVAAAAFSVVNDTTIQATVGTGATGSLSVTNPFGTNEMDGFVFGAIPRISSFSPAAGPVGSQVVLTGSGFDPVPTNNIVYFGGVKTTVVTATSTSLTIKVPAGAAPDWISVTTNSRTAYAGKHFVVTFPGSTAGFADSLFAKQQVALPGILASLADLDRDGKNDIIAISDQHGVFASRNISTKGSVILDATVDLMGQGAIAAATGDLDGDGLIDVVAASATTNTFQVFRNTTTGATISFAPAITFKAVDELQAGNGIAIGDVDGDGRPEVIFSSFHALRFTVLQNLSSPGKIAFADPLQYGFNGVPWGVTCEDVDNDGRAEVLLQASLDFSSRSGVAVFKNTGPVGVITMTQVPGASGENNKVQSVAYGDLDGDGRTEVAVSNYLVGAVVINKNVSTTGNPAFAGDTPIRLEQPASAMVGIGDLDGDGRPDVVVENDLYGTGIFKNISVPGAIALKEKVPLEYRMNGARFVDLDGDGALDIINGWGALLLNQTVSETVVELCPGADTALLAGVTATTYQWQQDAGNGFVNIQDNSNFSGTASDRLRLIDVPASWNGYKYRCLDNNMQQGRIYKLNISNTGVLPSVTIAAPHDTICVGANITFEATPVNGGSTPTFQWQVNGIPTGQNASTFGTNTLNDGDVVKVVMTSNAACTSTPTAVSNSIPITVRAILNPVVTITASSGNACADGDLTFKATSVHGGLAPVYLWIVNESGVQDNSDTYTTASLRKGDTVKALMTVSIDVGCPSARRVFSNVITIGGNAPGDPNVPVTPSVSITASSTNICTGAPVTFTATPINGGSAPAYQWQVNGVNAGQNASTFTSNTLTNGSIVRVILTSNASCAPGAPATSNGITVSVNTFVTPVVVLSGNTTVDQGSSTLIIAATLNGGTSPVYQWQDSTATHGWQDIPAATGFSINYAPAQTGDMLKVRLSSSLACAGSSTVFSAPISFVVNGLTGGRVAPNPVQNMLHIDQLQLSDNWETLEIASVSGGNKFIVRNIANLTSVDIPVSQLSKGMYVAVLRSKSGASKQIKFIKQ